MELILEQNKLIAEFIGLIFNKFPGTSDEEGWYVAVEEELEARFQNVNVVDIWFSEHMYGHNSNEFRIDKYWDQTHFVIDRIFDMLAKRDMKLCNWDLYDIERPDKLAHLRICADIKTTFEQIMFFVNWFFKNREKC